MTNNQGIAHLSQNGKPGGFPACRNRRAFVSVPADRFEQEFKPCKKCAAILTKWKAIRAKREAA